MACPPDGREVLLLYRNWKGEVAWRLVIPIAGTLNFGRTDFHQEFQWLVQVWDCDRQEHRSFALRDILYVATGPLSQDRRNSIQKLVEQARAIEEV